MNKKQIFENRLAALRAEIAERNPNVKPIAGTDSGSLGKLYEMTVKAFLGANRGKGVSGSNRTDTYIGGYALEIKQGASELEIFYSGKKVDYVCYCPDFQSGDEVERVSYVLDRDGFMAALEEAGMIRMKVGSDGTTRHTMQSYKNSNRKYNAWLDALDEHSVMTLSEYKAMVRGEG